MVRVDVASVLCLVQLWMGVARMTRVHGRGQGWPGRPNCRRM